MKKTKKRNDIKVLDSKNFQTEDLRVLETAKGGSFWSIARYEIGAFRSRQQMSFIAAVDAMTEYYQ